jgi:hypothetical protein
MTWTVSRSGAAMRFVCTVVFLVIMLIASQPSGAIGATQTMVQYQAPPPFARRGAFASYSAIGGFVAYFEGVSGNSSFTVDQVFTNGTMKVTVRENIQAGTDVPPTVMSFNVTDSYLRPKFFPAVPLGEMGTGRVSVLGVECTLVRQTEINVPAGTFRTLEFLGKTANGSSVFVWLDNATGLVVEMAAGGGALQLSGTNIAVPVSTQTPVASALPFTLAIALSWLLGISLFLLYRRKMQRRSVRRAGDG